MLFSARVQFHRGDSDRTQCVFRMRCVGASYLAVLGNFNNWSILANPMLPVGNDEWEAAVDLEPGPQPYCFFVLASTACHGSGTGMLGDGIIGIESVIEVPNTHDEPPSPAPVRLVGLLN